MRNRIVLLLLPIAFFLSQCGDQRQPKDPFKNIVGKVSFIEAPPFIPDSAYHFIEQQVSFGPRVPNTEAHEKCGLYLMSKLKSYGLEVIPQYGKVRAYNGETLNIQNIIARYEPEKEARIMLFAHWDTRPYADRDTVQKETPIDGANDGGSGVAVLLEIARVISESDQKPDIGIDIFLFDAEDYGQPHYINKESLPTEWCLGAQYWASSPPFSPYVPRYGILLDMVGASNAVFPKEGTSMYYAPTFVDRVWSHASRLGYGNLFVNQVSAQTVDDHLFVNGMAKIPSINIVHYDPTRSDYGTFHHTHRDNIEIIDKKTLEAVGNVVLAAVYNEI